MRLTKAEIAMLQRAERYRSAAKQAIDQGGSEAAVANNFQAAADCLAAVAQMIAVRRKAVSA